MADEDRQCAPPIVLVLYRSRLRSSVVSYATALAVKMGAERVTTDCASLEATVFPRGEKQ